MEEKNNKKGLKKLILIVIILLLIVSSLFVYFNYFSNNNEIEIENNNNETVKSLEDINNSFLENYDDINELYNLLHYKNWFFPDSEIFTEEFFENYVTTNTDISDEMKAMFAVLKNYDNSKIEETSENENTPFYEFEGWTLDECILEDLITDNEYNIGCGESKYTVFKISEVDFNNMINNIFGEDNGYNNTNVEKGSCLVELHYSSNDNLYKLYTGGGCGGTGNNIFGYYQEIQSITNNADDDIFITEKVIYTEVLNIVQNTKITNPYVILYNLYNGNAVGIEKYEEELIDDNILPEYFENYGNYLKEYRYIFKKDENGNYYFDSIELVN